MILFYVSENAVRFCILQCRYSAAERGNWYKSGKPFESIYQKFFKCSCPSKGWNEL